MARPSADRCASGRQGTWQCFQEFQEKGASRVDAPHIQLDGRAVLHRRYLRCLSKPRQEPGFGCTALCTSLVALTRACACFALPMMQLLTQQQLSWCNCHYGGNTIKQCPRGARQKYCSSEAPW